MAIDGIYVKLTEIMREVFDDDELEATPGLTADRVDGWDSLAHLRLIASVETAFGVTFAASQIVALQTVGDLAALIAAKGARA